MKSSPNIANLTKALLQAQKETGAAVKGSKNPFFKSSYADLPTVMEVVKEALNNNGVLILQPPAHRDGKNFIDTILIHANTGEWMSGETEVVCKSDNNPQDFGAAQTYARRFGLQAMQFIPAEDDDGNKAAGRTVATAAKPSYTPAPKVSTPEPAKTASITTDGVSGGEPAKPVAPLKGSSFKKAGAAKPTEVAKPSSVEEAGWN